MTIGTNHFLDSNKLLHTARPLFSVVWSERAGVPAVHIHAHVGEKLLTQERRIYDWHHHTRSTIESNLVNLSGYRVYHVGNYSGPK